MAQLFLFSIGCKRATCVLAIPKLSKLLKGKVVISSRPVVAQLVKVTGEGKVTIGEGCSFGYKLGGFHK